MKLKPGMTANIIIYTKEVQNALLIPAKALQFTPDSSLMKNYQIEGAVPHKGKHKHGTGEANSTQVLHTVKSRKDSTGAIPKQTAMVWILNGKKLTQKKIQIGLNDNTHVEVLRGLDTADNVVTGISASAADASTAATSTGGSPFLPKRGGSGKKK